MTTPESSGRMYDGYAAWKGWQSAFSYGKDEANGFLGELKGIPLDGRSVLELGFGNGEMLAWLRDQGASVIGTEINEDLLAAARDAGYEVFGPDLSALLPRYAGSLDLVVAFDLLEHLEVSEIADSLATLANLLAPEGRLIARFPNGQSPFGRFHQYGDVTHKSVLSVPIIQQLARGCNLEIETARNSYPGRTGNRLKQIAQMARTFLRRSLLSVIALLFATGTRNLDANVTVVLRAAREPADD